jgi:hypothetical protein
MQHAEVLRRLEREIELNGSLRRAAVTLGISPQYLSAILGGDRYIGPKLLRSMKLRRKVVKTFVYEEIGRRAHA